MQSAQGLPPHLQGEFMNMIEEMQLKDSVKMYNRIVEACSRECLHTFHSKALTGDEKKCVDNCGKKFLNMSKRIGQRFAEHQAAKQNETMQQQ